MNVIIKHIAVLNLSLLLMAIAPKNTFAQIIYGLDKARNFNTTHHGPFSIYAGTFRAKNSACQLRSQIAARTHYPVRVVSSGQLHSVVLGPLASPQTVRAIGDSLLVTPALKAKKVHKAVRVSQGQSKQTLTPLPPDIASKNVGTLIHTQTGGIRFTVLAGGSSYAFDQQGQVFFPAEAFRTDSYVSEEHKIQFASAIGISYEKILEPNKEKSWNMLRSISLGVNAYYNEGSQHGSVYQYGLPDFNNATYELQVRSFRVMLDTEWGLRPSYFGIMPFIEAGVGGAQNSMSFQNIPRPDIGADGGNYSLSDKARVHFAYELGAGLKLPLRTNVMVSARYLFADIGDARSGISDNETGVLLAYPVRTNVQSHSVLFGLSYLFG
ncbi:hypothetical protein TUM19329_29760 [Legionella antarctica]|uniref:SPOR domain-containing protein n=1 Tax=Legionella antarctica TaxID=2708020 RepID=A0A6F8T7F9_9GAMM|nr:SPOR domain-containing protein [Legionella antarctica]BCA96615.1 hypothetical protein TUM19329_29760 [Legionella antarctica]